MNISIMGNLGSGKSTVCKVLKEKGFEIITAGDIFRQLAKGMNISITDINERAKEDEGFDEAVDTMLRYKASGVNNTVFDSRLAWYFVPDSYKVFLKLDVEDAAKRVFEGNNRVAEAYANVLEAKEALIHRSEQEKSRYMDKYGVDIYDLSNYNMVIDTVDKTPEEIADIIQKGFEEHKYEWEEKCRFYNWYIDNDMCLHGNITNHPDAFNGDLSGTQPIEEAVWDEDKKEIAFINERRTYYAPIKQWDIEKQKENKKIKRLLPKYKKLYEISESLRYKPMIEPGNVLVCFSDYDTVRFNSLYFVEKEGEAPVEYQTNTNVGYNRDSYIINTRDYKIDIRYFWNWGIDRFYRLETQGLPLWFENVGYKTVYMGLGEGKELVLRPGERKLIKIEDMKLR